MSSYQSNEIKLINTSLIDPHPDNPRKNIGDVTDLAASIKTNGLLTPLSVVPNGERYRVIDDLRRSLDMDDGDVEATVDPDTGEID